MLLTALDDPAVCSVGSHMAWLVKEPESFPFFHEHTEVFRSEEQLTCSAFGNAGVDWQEASHIAAERYGQQKATQNSSHLKLLHEFCRYLNGKFRTVFCIGCQMTVSV